MKIGSLFSGIGGLELGLEMSGLGHVVWQVEQNPFGRSILAKHWPDVARYEDVRSVGSDNLAHVDLICGGFPCQDISSAGKGAGLAGSRSGLWYEYARIIDELGPEWVVIENVASGAKRWVDQVRAHLGELGYESLPVPLSAQDVGAPHLRKRIFLIAHSERVPSGEGAALTEQPGEYGAPANGRTFRDAPQLVGPRYDGNGGPPANANRDSESASAYNDEMADLQSPARFSGWIGGPTISPVCRSAHGVFDRVDGGIDAENSYSDREGLPDMRRDVRSQEVRGPSRGSDEIQEKETLLNVLYGQRDGTRGPDQGRLPKACSASSWEDVQQMWDNIKHATTSHEQGLEGQQAGESGNPMRNLSYETSLGRGGYPTPTVTSGIPDRVQRLKALGNAVVPQCAEVIGHMIRELSGV